MFFIASARQQSPPNTRPRLTTTIKISRGKRIYETSSDDSSDQDNTTDPEVIFENNFLRIHID